MKLSRRVARFNKSVNNRVQGVYAWIVPPWAVILHRGRRSGRAYRTPVLAFRLGRTLIVALLYGEESDWLRNLQAAEGGQVVRGGRTFELGAPRVVETSAAVELSRLSPIARSYCGLADKQVLAEIGERTGGFGPRAPAADRARPADRAPPPAPEAGVPAALDSAPRADENRAAPDRERSAHGVEHRGTVLRELLVRGGVPVHGVVGAGRRLRSLPGGARVPRRLR